MSDRGKRVTAALCSCFGLAVGLTQIVFFSISSYRFKYSSEDLLAAIKNNLETPFVLAVAERSSPTFDSKLNQTEIQRGAFVEEWPGTMSGCNCLYVNSCHRRNVRKGQLAVGVCSYNETLCGCSNVESTPSRIFSSLSGSEFDQKVDPAISFATVYRKSSDYYLDCEVGYSTCTRSSKNGIKFIYCVPYNVSCPLTDLLITNTGENPNPKIFRDGDFVKSSAGTYLWFSNSGLGGPITDLKISQQGPCLNSKFISWGLSRPSFPLNGETVRHCV